MSKEEVEFKRLDWKTVGNDTVVFLLEDGTKIKAKLSINRVGVATKERNPDGSPRYHIDFGTHLTIIPKDKIFKLTPPIPAKKPDDKGMYT